MNIKLGKAHKLSRRIKFRGLDVSIETDKGELRHWYDPHAQQSGSTKMQYPYGYIRRTKGVDGDHVDVYIGPNEQAKNVYVINQQKKPKKDTKKHWTQFDEQKCMLGFNSADAAKKAYLAHYNDVRFFGSMITLSFEKFEKQVLDTLHNPHKLKTAGFNQGLPNRRSLDTQSPSNLSQRTTFAEQLKSFGTVKTAFTRRTRINVSSLKSFRDSGLRNIKIASNRSNSPTFLPQTDGLIHVPTPWTSVNTPMSTPRNNFKIGNHVIQTIPITVMHDFGRQKQTPQMTFHDNAVLQSLRPVDVNQTVLCRTTQGSNMSIGTSHKTNYNSSSLIKHATWAEFEKKVKATFEQPKKIAEFTIPLPSNISVESTSNPVTEQALGTAGTLGAAAAVPAAGVWYGGRKAEQLLPKYQLVNPQMSEVAKRFSSLADSAGMTADDFVRQYVQHGSDLARAPAIKLPSGETLTGAQLNQRIRGSGGITQRISELLSNKPFTRGSQQHYQAFAKGPVPAYMQMAQEAYDQGIKAPRARGGEHFFKGKSGLIQDFATTVGEARYETAQQLLEKGKLHPTHFRQKLIEVMQKKMPNSSPADISRFVKSLEGRLLKASPETYKAHLEAIRAGRDATQLQNKLFAKANLQSGGRASKSTSAHEVAKRLRRLAKQQGITERISRLSPETQRKLLDQLIKADDPVMQMLNMRIREGWKAAPGQYNTMINPLMQYQKAHGRVSNIASKLRRGGKAALIASGGLAALPLLSQLFSGPKKSQIKIGRNIATDILYEQGTHHALQMLGFAKQADTTGDVLKDIGGYAGIGTSASLAGSGLALGGMGLEKRFGKEITEGEIAKLRKYLKVSPNVRHERWVPEIASHYDSRTRTVNTAPKGSGSSGFLAHEFGHAAGKRLTRGSIVGPRIGSLGALAALPIMYNLDPESDLAKAIPGATAVPYLPRLYEEGRASIKGYRGLRQLGHGRSALLSLIPAFATYIGMAAAPAAALEWIRRRRVER